LRMLMSMTSSGWRLRSCTIARGTMTCDMLGAEPIFSSWPVPMSTRSIR
jgi:hypothetical protein